MLIQTETTPNPATLKFLPGQKVMEAGTRDFATPEEAEASPLAEAIFSTGEVEGVFFGRDFISVTAAPGVEWRQLKPQVLEVLLDHRRWLAGPVLTLADLAAAAQLSVADYLGGIDWRGHKQTVDWYAVMKSRPSFRPLLGERMEVIVPPAHYDKVDF